jgi:hypothetical protein
LNEIDRRVYYRMDVVFGGKKATRRGERASEAKQVLEALFRKSRASRVATRQRCSYSLTPSRPHARLEIDTYRWSYKPRYKSC